SGRHLYRRWLRGGAARDRRALRRPAHQHRPTQPGQGSQDTAAGASPGQASRTAGLHGCRHACRSAESIVRGGLRSGPARYSRAGCGLKPPRRRTGRRTAGDRAARRHAGCDRSAAPPQAAHGGGQVRPLVPGRQMTKPFRCGYVAIVGRPNVGKSTLANALIGAKLSIVSRKAQTTRHRINGVLTRDHEQFVFVDTPGFQTRHGGAMNRRLNRAVTQARSEVDVVVHVVEAGKWSPGDEKLLPLLPAPEKTILVLSKVDTLKNKNDLFPFTQMLLKQFPYAAVVPVSAVKQVQLDQLLDEIAARLPEGEPMFEADTLTDRSMRFIVAELIREKIFRLVGDELPYGCTVVIEQWEENESGAR